MCRGEGERGKGGERGRGTACCFRAQLDFFFFLFLLSPLSFSFSVAFSFIAVRRALSSTEVGLAFGMGMALRGAGRGRERAREDKRASQLDSCFLSLAMCMCVCVCVLCVCTWVSFLYLLVAFCALPFRPMSSRRFVSFLFCRFSPALSLLLRPLRALRTPAHLCPLACSNDGSLLQALPSRREKALLLCFCIRFPLVLLTAPVVCLFPLSISALVRPLVPCSGALPLPGAAAPAPSAAMPAFLHRGRVASFLSPSRGACAPPRPLPRTRVPPHAPVPPL